MREKIKKFSKSIRILFFFLLTQKGIERFNESRFKSRKVKGRATSSENRKFFVAVMKGALGVVKKMLTNGGFNIFLTTPNDYNLPRDVILYKRAFVFIPFQIPCEILDSDLSCCIAVESFVFLWLCDRYREIEFLSLVLLKELLQLNKASGNENQTELISLN